MAGFNITGKDNNYVVLAGGGSKALTDFATSSDFNKYVYSSGENLIIGTSSADVSNWKQSGWQGNISTYNIHEGIYNMYSQNGWRSFYYTLPSIYASKKVAYSFDIMIVSSESTENAAIYIGSTNNLASTNAISPSSIVDTWTHIYGTLTLSSTPYFTISIRGTDEAGKKCSCRIKNLKVELGDFLSTWTPAHADIHQKYLWSSTITINQWSRICKLYGYGNAFIRVSFSQNSLASDHLYLISIGYTTSKIILLGANGYSSNSNIEVRVTSSDVTTFYFEVKNAYGYNSATTLSVACTALLFGTSITTYTNYTAGGGEERDKIVSGYNFITNTNTEASFGSTTTIANIGGKDIKIKMPSISSYATLNWVSLHYLSLSGGTITGSLTVSGNIIGNVSSANYLTLQLSRGGDSPSNSGEWSKIKNGTTNNISNRVLFWTIYDDGGPSTYGDMLEILSASANHWLPLLWFGSHKDGRMYYRNKTYNDDTWGSWRTIAWTSDLTTRLYSEQVNVAQTISWVTSLANDANHRRAFVYNTNSAEYSYLFGLNTNNVSGTTNVAYGTILKMGYSDKYLRILRIHSGLWYKTNGEKAASGSIEGVDWEKIYAGYADSAGSVVWGNVTSKPAATGDATTPVYWNGSGFTNCTTYSNASVNYANSAGYATYLTVQSYTPTNNTVAGHKAGLVNWLNNNTSLGIGNHVIVGESIINQWDNDSATYYASSQYAMIKIGGGYKGSTYGQWLLSSYNQTRVGIIGRNANTWSSIKWIAWTSDIPTKTSQLTNDSGFLTSHQSLEGYLPLSGGKDITGSYFLKNAGVSIILKLSTTSNYGGAIKWFKGGVSQNDYDPQIGHHNTGDTYGSITILPYATSKEPWLSEVGLYISQSRLKWENKDIIHSGNISSYALTSRPYIGTTLTLSSSANLALTGITSLQMPNGSYNGTLQPNTLSTNRTWTLPDLSGELSLCKQGMIYPETDNNNDKWYRIATLAENASANNRQAVLQIVSMFNNEHYFGIIEIHHRGLNENDYTRTIKLIAGNLPISYIRGYYTSYSSTFEIYIKIVKGGTSGKSVNTRVLIEAIRGRKYANYITLESSLVAPTQSSYIEMTSMTNNINISGSASSSTTSTYSSYIGTSSAYLTYSNIKSAYDWYQTMTTGNTDNVINKWKEVEAFLAGISDSSTALNKFVTLDTTLTISGAKTFGNQKFILAKSENNEIINLTYSNGSYYKYDDSALFGSNTSITNSLKFRWYEDYWVMGIIRGSSSISYGFGISLLSGDHQLDRFRVNKDGTGYLNGLLIATQNWVNTASNYYFKILGWNSSERYNNANSISLPFGMIINQQGNATSSISNYPTNYGYLLSFRPIGEPDSYTGVQMYVDASNSVLRWRSKWGSSWGSWKNLLDTNTGLRRSVITGGTSDTHKSYNANDLTQVDTLYVSSGDVNANYTDSWTNFPTSNAPGGGFSLFNITEGSYKRQIFGRYNNNHLYVRTLFYNSGAQWSDWSTVALTSDIPTKTSQLTNDSGFLTSHQSLAGYLPLTGGTMNNTAVISRVGTSVLWVNGRSYPIIKTTSYTGYNSILSMKTTNGSWDLGVYSDDKAYLTYITDTNFNAGTNLTTYLLVFPKKDGTIAITSDIPTVTNYYWADVKVSSLSNSAAEPTFARAFATHSDTSTSEFRATNSNGSVSILAQSNRGLYDITKSTWIVGTNGTNTWLSQGNVGIGTTTPSYKLHVNGNSYFNGSITAVSSVLIRNSVLWPSLSFLTNEWTESSIGSTQTYYRQAVSSSWGYILFNAAHKRYNLSTAGNINSTVSSTLIVQSSMCFLLYSSKSSSLEHVTGDKREIYYLPSCTADLTENKEYSILTTKHSYITNPALSAANKAYSTITIQSTSVKVMTDGCLSITKSLKVTSDWMDTGIQTNESTFTDGGGTYAVLIDFGGGAGEEYGYCKYYSGIMSIYTDATDSTQSEEILLHSAGRAWANRLYLRTCRTSGGVSNVTKILIAAQVTFTNAANITFKFKKLI